MPAALDVVTDAAAAENLTVIKAIPRSADHLALELHHPDGGMLAGQWFRNRDEALAVSAETTRVAPQSGVRLLSGAVLLQPGGADRKLRAVRRIVGSPGATVVAHRPEKRAVLRLASPQAETTYVKVVRPRRLERTVSGARVTVPGVAIPQVRAVDAELGTVTFAELPGRTLFDLLGDPTVTDSRIEKVGRAVGEAVRRLHTTVPDTGPATHDATTEVAVARRWAELAAGHQLLDEHAAVVDRLLAAAEEHLATGPGDRALLHRDLHDKQILVDGSEVGMLDFDLAAVGDPALDVANLLTHLELRARQGRCSADRAEVCAAAVRDGYGPVTRGWQTRIAGYQLAARARLACVYAFRPAHADAAAGLLYRSARTRPDS